MIRHETLALPQPVFVSSSHYTARFGHGHVVARRVFVRPDASGVGDVLYYEVRLANGVLSTVTPDRVCDPANISARIIRPAPLRIPAPPAQRGGVA